MIKIFETGDLHIGKKYNSYPDIREQLINSRFECLERMVRIADDEGCGIFVMAGDTFDNVSSIKVSDVRKVVGILAKFSGNVLVLPGNHDYYTDEAKVWMDFKKAMDGLDHNITILNEFKPYDFQTGEDQLRIFPAYCQSKHSGENNLDWIRNENIDRSICNIGIAHGAIKGLTPDANGEYFLMEETELSEIPVDAWIIGHTHIQYPEITEGSEERGYKIYNAGTPEQLDLHNNTEGLAFLISVDKTDGRADVLAKAVKTGVIRFYDRRVKLEPAEGAMERASLETAYDLDTNSIVRIRLQGTVLPEDYENRNRLFGTLKEKVMSYEIRDEDLSEQISLEKIRAEFPEIGIAAELLENLMDDPTETQMAYELLNECRE
ncbi:MAG: metallophosphoesterase [Eubacteriales bacterium]|nr:metallophosphoesterase [Eubacteriales bacterium]